MKIQKLTRTKSKAQAMVEFAIALPLLMLLLYGLIEAGRLLFMYSTVVTASRQAVRYGSATGENAAGTPRYGDCDGIRAAAQKVAYLGPFDSITIAHNSGPGDAGDTYCTGPSDNTWSPADNSQRISVTVSKQFTPIVPKIVPFLNRTITATSNRTILVGVAIVVVQPTVEYFQYATATEIVSFNPEPSQPDLTQDVTIHVKVINTDDPSITPTGQVVITGADGNCTVPSLDSNGEGTCILHFANSGFYSISADYTGDDQHLPSNGTAVHEVNLAPTITTIVSDTPDPSGKNQDVVVTVQVTGGSTTPTGTVDVDAGGNRRCTITLSNGVGNCTINFNQTGTYSINATYSGDNSHQASSDGNGEPHLVLSGTATPTTPPTSTPIPPTATITPAPPTATAMPTAVPACNGVTHGPLVKSGNTLSMTVNNPYSYPLTAEFISVRWNDDKGHEVGTDKTLKLLSATFNGTVIWNSGPTPAGQSDLTINTPGVIPANSPSVSIIFYFHQSYDNLDGTEFVSFNLTTNGCNNLVIDSRY